MKRILTIATLAMVLLAACKKNDHPAEPEKPEAEYLRLVISDADKAQITVLEPVSKKTTVYPVQSAQPTLYATSTGQFAAIISRAANVVEFFNTGIEAHGGHLHVHPPEMSPVQFTQPGPTHFFAHEGLNTIFNDGAGSLSIFKDSDLESGEGRVLPVADPHHGAMVIYDDHTIAVTQKDGSASGTLPEKVKIIDRYGATLHEATIVTKGIHGDAGNGKLAAFGSQDGILIVNQNGAQSLVQYPADFGANWFGTILGRKGLPHFFGYTAALGLYKIDPANSQITPVLKNDQQDILQYVLDTQGKYLYVLLKSGQLKVFDAVTAQLKTEGKVTAAIRDGAAAEAIPSFAVSQKVVYVTDPATGAVKMFNVSSLKENGSVSIGGRPFKLLVVGDQQGLAVDNH
ncbi:hypothetical protein ACFOTA_20510 [Chitinophaga sp. GCM10012297]|uniref:Uncharacterized protein n=1 Tax=Chitinophaga chungangae TaxID=2821488 RepID=A0ABS3YIU7_9BACT|nr:hypothetical protein [Chitinophaga chungangae]MBO9154608.1 hypothetical protein [Chitinophaga chungangae]